MLRPLVLAVAASVTLGLVALAPTSASAHQPGWGHRHHHNQHRHWGGYPRFAFGGPAYGFANPCLRTRWVPTPWGPRPRRLNVCF